MYIAILLLFVIYYNTTLLEVERMKYNDIEDIVKMLKHIMVDDGLRQKDIVVKSGKSKQTISNLFNMRTDSIGINTLKELCNSLGYDLYIDIVKRENTDTE